jgi:hypothetical protein
VQLRPFTGDSSRRPPEDWPPAGQPELKALVDEVDEAKEIKGSSEARVRLLDLLARDPILRDPATKDLYEVVEFAPVLP